MRKVFKKTIASVVAGVTLAVGMTAMSSSAYWASRNFGSDATAYLSVSSTSVYGYTSCKTAKRLTVYLYNYDGTVTNGNPYGYGERSTKVTATVTVFGFTFSNSSPSAGGYNLENDMTVYL